MSSEILAIYNDNFEPIGQADYKTVHTKGMWHEVIHCWIIDTNTLSIVYQKRSKEKIIYPEMLDVSVAGHCRVSENPTDAVCREAFEELGIEIEPSKLFKVGLRRDAFSTKEKINREFQHIYFYKTKIVPERMKIESSELKYVVLLKPSDVLKAIKERQNIVGRKIFSNSVSEMEIEFNEFIPSIDNYNSKIPFAILKYLNGDKRLYF